MPRRKRPLARQVDRVAYRYSSYDTPFWACENSEPGRWHAFGDGATQYLSLGADGAWAELIRHEQLTTEDEVAQASMQMWSVSVGQGMVADYSTFALADKAGFDAGALVGEDHGPCRREGARLRELGYRGVLAVSAALPGEVNLTLFGPRTASAWGRPPLLASSLPATVIARGAPPAGLVGRVRRIGTPHAGLAAYRSARRGGARRTGDQRGR